MTADPLYPFGYGLSYSKFHYSSLVVTPTSITAGQSVTVTVTVTNRGPYDADEVRTSMLSMSIVNLCHAESWSISAALSVFNNSQVPAVVFHSCWRHDIQTTAAVFYLTSSRRSARSSLYSRQAGVSGFWCHRLERPASPRRICAVTRGFQTTAQDLSVFPFLARHCHMTHLLLLPFITTVLIPVVLAVINII